MCKLLLPATATVDELKSALALQFPHYSVHRQYLTKGVDPKTRTVLAPGKSLTELGIQSGDTLVFKDLGPQISWKTVFHVEYFGPILIHTLFYLFPTQIYSLFGFSAYELAVHQHHSYWNPTQKLCFLAVMLHYIKRELETQFVHRFSNATMPAFNIFKNSFHYWILSGLSIAYFLYHPYYKAPFAQAPPSVLFGLFALFLVCEASNFYCHVILMNLRPPGTRVRNIPRGFLFEYVSCGNYTAELAAWLVFCVMCNVLSAWFFFAVSSAQIAAWALKKHIAYKKEFGKSYPRRKILVPFIW